MMDLKNRGVFLTGGGQGIGRAVIAALLEKGAKVLFADINKDTGKAVEKEFQNQYSVDVIGFFQCDVTKADQLKAAFDAAVAKFGAVEICLNNAGIMDERIWEKMIEINVSAQIRGSQIAVEHMRRDKGGRGGVIVNTVSIAGFLPGANLPVYIATKHAMLGYTTSCASDPDMVNMGIRWCALCPMPVNTQMIDFSDNQDRIKEPEKFVAMCKQMAIAEPEDIAKGMIKLLEETDNNGCALVVGQQGPVYRRRVMVDNDGSSNPLLCDKILENHPPVPSSS